MSVFGVRCGYNLRAERHALRIPPTDTGTSSDREVSDHSEGDSFLRAIARTPERTPLLPELSPGTRALGQGRFEIVRRLGEGGFGAVYEVVDHKRSAHVALKVLRRADPGSLYLFKQEFRSLAGLSHPNLVELYELHAADGLWFFTMELVEGQHSTASFAGARASLRFEPVRAFLRELCAALSFLHAHGKLHRDIKPSNVLVRPDGRPVLLDFGLVTDLHDLSGVSSAGTPAYMAPEGTSSPASDCYALGVLLHEALTGELPGRATPPAEEADLALLCADLLRPDPRARPTAEDVLARLGSTARWIPPPPFVGRAAELGRLDRALEAAKLGQTVFVSLHGPSGIGKSALLQHFLSRAPEGSRGMTLAGRCFAQESVPYKGFDGVIDALYRCLLSRGPEERRALLPSDPAILGRLFPVLQRLPEIGAQPKLEEGDDLALRRRAFTALRELFARLAQVGLTIVAIDDLQWGDLDSVKLLLEILRRPDPPPLLLLAAYRSDKADRLDLIEALEGPLGSEPYEHLVRVDIPIAELDRSDSSELAAAVLSRTSAAMAPEDLASESLGVPFFITQLAYEDPPPGSALGVERLLGARIQALSPQARRLLETVSIAGRPLPRSIAARAALSGDGGSEEPYLLSSLVTRRLLRLRSAEELLPYHDRIGEIVLGAMSPEERRERHLRLAQTLEAERAEPEELIHHLLAGGRREEAARYAVIAADRAHEALALESAAALYTLALESGAFSPEEALRIRVAKASALGCAGRPREAAEAHLDVVRGAPSGIAHAHKRLAMEMLLLGGYIEEGTSLLDDLLREVGVTIPRSWLGERMSLPLMRAKRSLWGMDFVWRDDAMLSEQERLRIDTCWSAALGIGVQSPLKAATLHAKHLDLALAAGEPMRVARALLLDAAFSAMVGDRSRSLRALTRGQEIACRVDDPYLTGFSLLSGGVAALSGGRWREGVCSLAESERALAQIPGARWEKDFARSTRLSGLWMLGEIRELSALSRAFIEDTRERGNRHGAMLAQVTSGSLADLAADRPDLALAGAHSVRESLPQPSSMLVYRAFAVEIRVAFYLGQRGRALALLQERWPAIERAGLPRIEVAGIELSYWRGLAAVDAASSAADPLLDRARAEARRLARCPAVWGRAIGVLLQASIARRSGRESLALDLLEQAERDCADNGMALAAALAKRRRGEWLAGEHGARLVEGADEWLLAASIASPARVTAMVLG